MGRLDPEVPQMYERIMTHTELDAVGRWCNERTVMNLVDKINQRKAPVYLSQNFGDDLFWPNSVMELFARLEGPKHLDINQGLHASFEIGGLLGFPSHVWDETHAWMDHYLKGKKLARGPAVTMQVKFSKERDAFDTWEPARLASTVYHLTPPVTQESGGIGAFAAMGESEWNISSEEDSGATTGDPLLSTGVEAHLDIPITVKLSKLHREYGIVFEGEPLADDLKLRGISRLRVQAASSLGQALLVAYLYDVNPRGVGTLITHGKRTVFGKGAQEPVELDIELKATAYDLDAGHRLAMVIDTSDGLYGPPTTDPYRVRFFFGQKSPSQLILTHR